MADAGACYRVTGRAPRRPIGRAAALRCRGRCGCSAGALPRLRRRRHCRDADAHKQIIGRRAAIRAAMAVTDSRTLPTRGEMPIITPGARLARDD